MSYVGKINVSETEYPISATLYGECSTLASTAEKAVTLANFDTLMTGAAIAVKFLYSNTADNPTLNVNGTGAKSIYKSGVLAPGKTEASSWAANAVVTFIYDGTSWMMESGKPALSEMQSELLTPFINAIYPVGSIYMSTNSTSPASLFGVGTWEQLKDRFLVGVGDNYANGATGGMASVTLTAAQSGLPAHNHSQASHSHGPDDGSYTWLAAVSSSGVERARVGLSTSGRYAWVGKNGASSPSDSNLRDTRSTSAATPSIYNNSAASASQAHENRPPYLAVYMWKRTA